MNIKDVFSFVACFSYILPAFADGNSLVQLIDKAEYQLDTTVTGYFKSPAASTADDDDIAFLGRFTVKSSAWLSDNFSTGVNLYAAYSTQKQAYLGAFRNPGDSSIQPKYVDFNNAWLLYESDDFELILGKDNIDLGLSELYSPVDRFGLSNLTNPSQIFSTGVWQAGIDYFIADDTLSLKVIPVYERSLLPSQHSRWLGNTEDPEFTTLASSFQIETKHRPVRIENVAYLLQYKGSRAGYDFFALAHHGASIYPTLRSGVTANKLLKTDPLAASVAAGVLKVIDQWTVNAEAIYQYSYNNLDEDYIRYALGVSYTDSHLANRLGLTQIKTSVQWSGDESVDAEESNTVSVRSREARLFRNTIFAKIEIEHNHEWAYLLSATHNIESDFALLAGAEYKPNDNLALRLEGAFFDGADGTHFGRWQENDYLRFRTVYKF